MSYELYFIMIIYWIWRVYLFVADVRPQSRYFFNTLAEGKLWQFIRLAEKADEINLRLKNVRLRLHLRL